MSQEVEIIEGGRGRSFSRVNRIKTDKQDGGACFWVPENERRLTSLYAFQNGEYEPGNGYYAFDSVDASVMHFDDFDINIDDYDLPHIDLDGIDITIDEIGIPHIGFDYEIVTVDDETIKVIYPDGKEVIIHGPDLDGLINIDDVFTIDYDKETGTWTITAIVNVTSGDNEFAPGDIVAQWPGTEHVDIHIGQSISIPDLGDIDLDLDADLDVSLDLDDMDVDISGIDMDGLDVDVNIDLDTLDMNTFELPDEIRIMHVPNKTSYKDGEEIDLDGLVVQAYRNGSVWEDKDGKYFGGYIPVHELIIDPLIAHAKNKYRPGSVTVTTFISGKHNGSYFEDTTIISYSIEAGITLIMTPGGQHHIQMAVSNKTDVDGTGEQISYGVDTGGIPYEHRVPLVCYTSDRVTYNGKSFYTTLLHSPGFYMGNYDNPYSHYPQYYTEISCTYSVAGDVEVYDFRNDPDWWNNVDRLKIGYDMAYSNATKISVSWPRPHDNKILTASFDISVEEGDAQASGNASDTDDTPNGHWGGTTVSGDHGGSHSSGNF